MCKNHQKEQKSRKKIAESSLEDNRSKKKIGGPKKNWNKFEVPGEGTLEKFIFQDVIGENVVFTMISNFLMANTYKTK